MNTRLPHCRLVRVLVLVPRGPERVMVASPVPRPVTVRVAVFPFGPVAVVELPPGYREVVADAVLPLDPVTVRVLVESPLPDVR